MKAWRVCGNIAGEVIFADDATAASAKYEWDHGELPEEVTPAPSLDGEPRDNFSNAELQGAGFAVFCDRCLDAGAIEHGIDEPDQWPLAIVDGETVCDGCITPREKLAAGGDPADCTYAAEYMDTPMGSIPHGVEPLESAEELSN